MAKATLEELSLLLNSSEDKKDRHAYGKIVDVIDKKIGHDSRTGAEVKKRFYKVSIAGSEDVVECAKLVGAGIGDTVMVMTMANGYSVVTGRVGGDQDSIDVQNNLDRAAEALNTAVSTINQKLVTVESVTNVILDLAETAHETVEDILTNWQTSSDLVSEMHEVAEDAHTTLKAITENSVTSYGLLSDMRDYAESADKTLVQILDDAEQALVNAGKAQKAADEAGVSAREAGSYATGALRGLSEIENVVGTLNWIAEHGEYVPTQDTEVDPTKQYYTKVYYELTEDTAIDPDKTYYVEVIDEVTGDRYYTAVETPVVEDIGTYYEKKYGETFYPVTQPRDEDIEDYHVLSINKAITNYINMHLSLDNEGLHVTSSEPNNPGWEVLVTNTGVTIRDEAKRDIASYSDDIRFADWVPYTIGNNHTYVKYYDSDNDNIADSIEICVDDLLIGSSSINSQIDNIQNEIDSINTDQEHANDSIESLQENVTDVQKVNGKILIDPDTPKIIINKDDPNNLYLGTGNMQFTTNGSPSANYGVTDAKVPHVTTTKLSMKNSEGTGDLYWIMRSNKHLSLKL